MIPPFCQIWSVGSISPVGQIKKVLFGVFLICIWLEERCMVNTMSEVDMGEGREGFHFKLFDDPGLEDCTKFM